MIESKSRKNLGYLSPEPARGEIQNAKDAKNVKPAETFWTGKKVLVTGGASFIGSTLTDQLLARGAKVRIVDDLTSGHLDNLRQPLAKGEIEFMQADLRNRGVPAAGINALILFFISPRTTAGAGMSICTKP